MNSVVWIFVFDIINFYYNNNKQYLVYYIMVTLAFHCTG